MRYPRIPFMNTYLDVVNIGEVVDSVFSAIESGMKLHLVFINALKISEIRRNLQLGQSINNAELILADGMPIVWAAKYFFGYPRVSRVNGTDLFERLLVEAASRGKRVFLMGSTEEILARLKIKLRADYPTLIIAGARNGYFTDHENESIIREINESNSDILFVGISSPRKELWVSKHKYEISTPVIQGVGGSFDVVAGVVPRAPRWLQAVGLEWLFRVIQEPRRMFLRYLNSNSVFLYMVIKYVILEKIAMLWRTR